MAISREKNTTRNYTIDSTRGLAILLVVLGHCIGTLEDPVNRFILSFHMPLFFFLSGMCSKSIIEDSLGKYVLKNMRTLLIPLITKGVINVIYDVLIRHFLLHNVALNDIDYIGLFMAWFLLSLFYVRIIYFAIVRFLDIDKLLNRCILTVFLLVAVIANKIIGIDIAFKIDIIPMALLFYLFGHFYMAPVLRENRFVANGRKIFDKVWIVFVPVMVIISYWNEPVTMYINNYGNLLLFFVGALGGIAVSLKFGRELQNNRLLIFFGQNSIIVYVLHFKLIKVVHGVGKIAFSGIENNNTYPAYWHYYLICIIILAVAIPICNKRFGILFGKKVLRIEAK